MTSKFPPLRGRLLPSLSRGLVFDLGILVANGWLVPALVSMSGTGGEMNPAYALILLVSVGLYGLGTYLKRNPLSARRIRQPSPPAPGWALIALFVLLIMQFALWMLHGLLSLGVFEPRIALLAFLPDRDSPLLMILVLILAAAPLILTLRALVPPREVPEEGRELRRQEAFADAALYLSAVVSLSIWDGMIMASLAGRGPYPWYAGALLMILITVPYAMFYAAPRLLFLVEDYRERFLWLRLGIVMIPLSLRLLGGGAAGGG